MTVPMHDTSCRSAAEDCQARNTVLVKDRIEGERVRMEGSGGLAADVAPVAELVAEKEVLREEEDERGGQSEEEVGKVKVVVKVGIEEGDVMGVSVASDMVAQHSRLASAQPGRISSQQFELPRCATG